MKKLFILQILSLIPVIGWCATGNVFTAISENVLITYKILSEEDKTCQVGIGIEDELAIPEDYEGPVVIPEQVNGYKVTTIGRSALDTQNITAVTIPSTIISIQTDGLCGTDIYISDLSAWCNIDFAWYETHEERYSWGAIRNLYLNGEIVTNLVIPDDVSAIKDAAFRSCRSISMVDCSNVKTIGEAAFYYCENIVSVKCYNVSSISNDAFFGCSKLKDFTASGILTYIGQSAFKTCKELNNFNIPDNNNLRTIDELAFSYTGIKQITLPNIVSIRELAFSNTPLASILIGRNVTSIGTNAFLYCENLNNVYCLADEVPSTSIYAFGNSSYRTATLHVPAESTSSYQSVEPWKYFNSIVPITNSIAKVSDGYATYCSPIAADYTSTPSLKAYIASGFSPSTGELLLTRVYQVPAGEGVLLKGEAGDYEVAYAETDMVYSNLLKGVTTATEISPTDGDYTNFILANGSHGIGFYTLSQTGEIAAGKAYLQLPTSIIGSAAARGMKMRFDDEDNTATTITDMDSRQTVADDCYDLQGRKVNAGTARKGIYIVRSADGRKLVKKIFTR